MKSNTTTVIAELQSDHSLTITQNRKNNVGCYNCVGDSRPSKGIKNMSAFSVFKTFSEIESFTFFGMLEYRNKITNEVCVDYIDSFSEYELKRFRKAIKSLIEKDCIRLASKKAKSYMVNPQLILGSFELYDELVKKYQSLPK